LKYGGYFMGIPQFFVCPHRSQCFWAVRLLVFLAVAVVLWPQYATGQHSVVPKLTLSQVEQLVSNKVPDSTLSAQIQRRGLAFAPNPSLVDSLHAKGAGPLTLAAIEVLVPKASLSDQTSRAASVKVQSDESGEFTTRWAHGADRPSGIAVDRNGNIFVAEPSTPSTPLKEILAEGDYNTVRTLCTGASIWAMTVRGNGNIFVAGPGYNEVDEIRPADCGTIRLLPSTEGFAVAVAEDASGNVFLADSGRLRMGTVGGVKEIPVGCLTSSCVKMLGGGFNQPRGVAADGGGNVFVADTDNNAVKEIPPGCAFASCVKTLGGGFSKPLGVAVDGRGNVFVADTGNDAVKVIPPRCLSAGCVRTAGSRYNHYYSPAAVAVDKSGNVFVADAVSVVELGYTGSPEITTASDVGSSEPTAKSTDSRKMSIPASVAVGLLMQKRNPDYPPIAKAAHITGTVVLQATISETGSVEELRVVSGPAMLQQAAMDAVKTWQYRPYMVNNKPVEVESTVNVIFTLGN
jgi:TonB family protein